MVTSWWMGVFQGWPTHQSVSTVNPAPTAKSQDLPAAPCALLTPTPTRVPPSANSATQTSIQVCMTTFTLSLTLFSTLTRFFQIYLNLLPSHICMSPRAHMQSRLHANVAFITHRVWSFFLSRDLNVNCVFFSPSAPCFLTASFFFQSLVQEAANPDLRVQTMTSITPIRPATLRAR